MKIRLAVSRVFHIRLKLLLSSYLWNLPSSSGRVVVGTVVYEVGDVALGNAKCRLRKPFGGVETNEGRCALPGRGGIRYNL
jgi:hypothetical protein